MILSKFKKALWAGFSLIELMIVIAIIGILAAVAVPAYQGYVIKARVSELMEVAYVFRTAVTEYYMATSSFPTTNSSAGLALATDVTWTASNKVTSAYVDTTNSATSGKIWVIGNPNTGTGSLGMPSTVTAFGIQMSATTSTGGSVSWTCSSLSGSATAGSPYAPAPCRSSCGSASAPTAPTT